MDFEYNSQPNIEKTVREYRTTTTTSSVNHSDGHFYKRSRVSYYVKDIFKTNTLKLKSLWRFFETEHETDVVLDKYMYLYAELGDPEYIGDSFKKCENLHSKGLYPFSCSLDWKLEFYGVSEKLKRVDTFQKEHGLPPGFVEELLQFRHELFAYCIGHCIKDTFCDYYPFRSAENVPTGTIIEFLKNARSSKLDYDSLKFISDEWSSARLLSKEHAIFGEEQKRTGSVIVVSRNMIFTARLLTIYWDGTYISFVNI